MDIVLSKSKIAHYYLYLLFFLPLIGYYTIEDFNRRPIYYFQFAAALIFLIYVVQNRISVQPKFIIYLFLYSIYIWIWNTQNGYLLEKGIVKFLFTNMHFYNILLIIIIYHSQYNSNFISKTVLFIKIWFIVLIIGQLLQLFYDPYIFVPEFWRPNIGDNPSIYEIRRPSVFALVSDHEIGVSILALFSLLYAREIKEKSSFPTIWIILSIAYAILTNTRYIMIGCIIILFQFNSISYKITKKIKYIIPILISLTLSYYIVSKVFNYNLQDFYTKRLFKEQTFTKTSRYFGYLVFKKNFPENAWFGTGVHLTDDISKELKGHSSQIHIGFLSHLVSYGIFGSTLLFGFWFSVLRFLYKRARLTKFYGSFYAFLMLIWANITLVTYEIFYVGIIFAFVFDKYYWDMYVASFKLSKLNSPKLI